jgi:hypothetical protein
VQCLNHYTTPGPKTKVYENKILNGIFAPNSNKKVRPAVPIKNTLREIQHEGENLIQSYRIGLPKI